MNAQNSSFQDREEKSSPAEELLESPEEGVVRVGALPVVVYCPTTYGGSDMGFYKQEWSIEAIYDRDGRPLQPVFGNEWKEIAPGIATANRNQIERRRDRFCKQAIRIERRACPVRVIFKYVSEYNAYDDYNYKECSYYYKDTIETIFKRSFFTIRCRIVKKR